VKPARVFGAILSTLLGPAALFGSGTAEAARAIVDSGHAGAVRWIEFDEKRGLLFSAGDDGTVRIWDPASGGLVRVLQVSQLATGKIAVNPSAPQFAVVVTGGPGASFLSVWDWEKERQVYRVPLREDPLFLRYSGLGTYILYGESSWQGLKIVRAADGTPAGFHPEGFGIVGFAETSRTEKTLMTYQVSGRITYWDLASGARSIDVEAVPYLAGMRISPDRGSLFGFSPTEIVRMDAVTGAVRGRVPIAGVRALDVSPSGDELTCISGDGGQVTRWTLNGDSLTPAPAPPLLPGVPALVAYGSGAVYFAGASGVLAALNPAGDVSEFGRNVIADLSGFDAGRGMIALASRDLVRVFATDALDGAVPLTALRTLLAPNPFSAAAGLAFTGDGKLLTWVSSGAAGSPALAALDLGRISAWTEAPRAFSAVPSPFRAALTGLRASAEELVGIESGGMLRIADPLSGAARFGLRIPGSATAIRVSSKEIMAGRNTSSGREGSLLRVNLGTGETVALRGRNIYTYALILDRGPAGSAPILYSVGIDAARSTNLMRHDGPGFETETLLDSVAEEDLDAGLSLDPDSHELYAALGRDRVVAWDGRTLRTLALENSVPRLLVARGSLLFSVNRDSTITVADAKTGAQRARLALFKDGEWAAVFTDGTYTASTGGDLHVRVIADGSPVAAREDYRLRIDTR
jgi:hypothetical protein